MKKYFLLFLAFGIVLTNCKKNDDDVSPDDQQQEPEEETVVKSVADYPVQDFMWLTLNSYYFWQESVANLADSKRTAVEDPDYIDFLAATPNPEDFFFDQLLSADDRFSFLDEDYRNITNSLQGVSRSDGVEFGLSLYGGGDDIFGYVTYILPGSDADGKEIERGDIFIGVNGTNLNRDNYRELLFGDLTTYTLNFAVIEDNTIVPNGRELSLTKEEGFEKDPIQINKTFDVAGKKVGYLMYNEFSGRSGEGLNDAFGELKAAGVSELVLDLRYNPGGFGYITQILGSLIYGPNPEDLFYKRRFNSKIQATLDPGDGETNFVNTTGTTGGALNTPLNSLTLNKIYVLATRSSASASELLMNGLEPYLDVVHIGTTTTGKNQGSITFVDDPENGNFYDEDRVDQINPNNQWGIQPIVSQVENSEGFGDYADGLVPDIELAEDVSDLGVLGDPSERLLARALSEIEGASSKRDFTAKFPVDFISSSALHSPLGGKLLFKNVPAAFKENSFESMK